jgi:hypothetical protein
VSCQLAWNSKQAPILACLELNSRRKRTFLHVSEYVRFRNRRALGYLIASPPPVSDTSVRYQRGTRDVKAWPNTRKAKDPPLQNRDPKEKAG